MLGAIVGAGLSTQRELFGMVAGFGIVFLIAASVRQRRRIEALARELAELRIAGLHAAASAAPRPQA
ncbi:MAG: hypothetical protein ABI588_10710, partial [Arenimonas sp.]